VKNLPLHRLKGWGCYPDVSGREIVSEDLEKITENAVLTRGQGRSFGDSSLPPMGGHSVASSRHADRILEFQEHTGVLRAEPGLTLYEMNKVFLPQGWVIPVSPETQYGTLGGMVATDIHGMNHHQEGCLGEYVRRLILRVGDGKIVECSLKDEPKLFRATLGGMGLTGHILEVELQMKRIASPWIWSESERFGNLENLLERMEEVDGDWQYTHAWIDTLASESKMGRGILIKGKWADIADAPDQFKVKKEGTELSLLPSWFLNPRVVRAWTSLKYRSHFFKGEGRIIHPQKFFYPSDYFKNSNRLYGKQGMTRYQCVLPIENDLGAVRYFLEILRAENVFCSRCGIKRLGLEGLGTISFPMPGISISLDIPILENQTQHAVDALNEFVISQHGRINLATDAFTRRQHFHELEPRLKKWLQVRNKWDPEKKIRSAQSVRLLGDPL
jgi:decaprenylphospho-beta-D-ribofuranose 2-oxidase